MTVLLVITLHRIISYFMHFGRMCSLHPSDDYIRFGSLLQQHPKCWKNSVILHVSIGQKAYTSNLLLHKNLKNYKNSGIFTHII